jgi:diguanylate cyclase (GGDEF)-like protein
MTILTATDLSIKPDTRILIVDDDPLILEVLGTFISSLGHKYQAVEDGERAVAALQEREFTLVITDMIMPKMDGMTLLKHIQKNHPRIDVIVVTGYTGEFSYTDVIKAGASDFISKPFNTDELEAKLNRIIREQSLMRELERLSISDSLTDLYNRRFFDTKLKEEVHRAHRQEYPVFLMMLDVDKFKEYNDTYGHQAGDKVLQALSHILSQCTRENVDWTFRIGGDEFAIIIPYTAKSQTIQVAERILQFYREYDFTKTSLSIGLARFTRHDNRSWAEDVDFLVSNADAALYKAKEDGGNMVVCAEDDS